METKRIVAVLDRIAHASTTALDCEQSILGLRRMLQGKRVSDILELDEDGKPKKSVWEEGLLESWQQELKELRDSEREKQQEISRLRQVIAGLQQRTHDEQPIEGFYTRVQINAIILTKFGKNHGVKKALVEKNLAQRKTNPQIPKITDNLLQLWQRNDRYPAYVVEQLNALTKADLLSKRTWTAEETAFLRNMYNDNPRLTNQELAERCSKQFGRYITDCAIRGALTRARAANQAGYR